MDWFSSMKVNKYIHTLCTILFTHNFQFCLAGFSLLKPSTTKINRQTVLVRNANAIVLRPGTCCIVFVSYKSSGFIYRFRRYLTDLGNLSTFFICMFIMSSPQVPSSVFKAVCVSDHRILKSSKSTNQMIDVSVVKNIMSNTEKQRSSKQEMPQCIAKVRNTHGHHPFMYSYTSYHDDVCPHLWAPSSAINVYSAPGAEVVICCQRARPR